MTLTKISIELNHKQYAEIEEYCLNKGLTISEYFSALHELNTQFKWRENIAADERFKEFQDKFEKMGHTDPNLDPVSGFNKPGRSKKEMHSDKESLQEDNESIESQKSKKKKLKQ